LARASEAPTKESVPAIVGAISPGMAATSLREWRSEPGVHEIRLPLGAGADRDLTLYVFSRRGVAAVVRNNEIETVGILSNAQAFSARGVRPGNPAVRVEAAYGRPAGVEGIQALNV